ncbi:MAG: DUF4384 domain-containing protein [Pleurocapsa sp. SU_196_0]|nr:DUF4384 domain-containing protein [Pleurocapsa sp. SU_196_0]
MKKFGFLALAFSTLALSSAMAQSAPRVSPQAVIVNPVTTDLQTRIWVDRGGDNPVYYIGEKIRINVSVNQDAYVYVFSIHSDGVVDLILPNRLSGGNEFLRANETRSFPPSGANYQLSVDGPAGQDKLLAVASKRQLNLNEIATFKTGQPFAEAKPQGQEGLARALAVVVTPVPANDWTTAYTQFQVRGAQNSAPSNPPVSYPSNPQPANPPVSSGTPGGISINVNVNVNVQPGNVVYTRYGLTLLPGMSFVRYENRDDDEVTFLYTSNNSMTVIADGYRRQLEGRGWRSKKMRADVNSVRLEFQSGRSKLKLEIERAGGAYRLKFEADR